MSDVDEAVAPIEKCRQSSGLSLLDLMGIAGALSDNIDWTRELWWRFLSFEEIRNLPVLGVCFEWSSRGKTGSPGRGVAKRALGLEIAVRTLRPIGVTSRTLGQVNTVTTTLGSPYV